MYNSINETTIQWLEALSRNLDTDSDIVNTMPVAHIHKELGNMGVDTATFVEKIDRTVHNEKLAWEREESRVYRFTQPPKLRSVSNSASISDPIDPRNKRQNRSYNPRHHDRRGKIRVIYEDWRSHSWLDRFSFILVINAFLLGLAGVLLNLEKLSEQAINIYMLSYGSVIVLFLATQIGAAYRLYIEEKLKREIVEEENAQAFAAVKSEKEKAIGLICDELHHIAHGKRDVMVQSYGPLALDVGKTVDFLNSICDSIQNVFENAFNVPSDMTIRVEIKGFISPENVVTIARDRSTLQRTDSQHIRDEREEHRIENNSAFESLFSMKRGFVFAHDHLLNDPEYKNSTPNWHHLYTNCMVVPIVKRSVDGMNVSEIAGFIITDSFGPNKHSPIFCDSKGQPVEVMKSFLLACADCIFTVLKRGITLRVSEEQPTEPKYLVDTENVNFIRRLNENLCAIQRVRLEHSRHTRNRFAPYQDRDPLDIIRI